jgi:hypothetical protein
MGMLYVEIDLNAFKTANGEVGDDKLLRYWRKDVIEWHNTREIVDLYNEFLNEDVSIRWWQRLEKENRVPADLKRRWVIARLLDIPAVYLGLAVSEIAPPYSDKIKLPIPTTKAVNTHQYNKRLLELWASPYGNQDEVLMRIYALQEALLYGSQEQREQVAYLLCQYLVLCGAIQRGAAYLSSAIWYLSKAIELAKERAYDELLIKALYQRGYCFYEKWRVSQDKVADHHYLLQVKRDIDAAKIKMEKAQKRFISSALQGAILDLYGRVLASMPQDEKDRTIAVNKIDEAGNIIRSTSFQHDEHFLQIDQDWYLLGKAQIYLTLGSPKSALDILPKGNPHKMRRFLTGTILEAEAYTARGQIEVGVEYALDALKVAGEITAPLHLARINSLYTSLREQDKYKRNSDVARLGLELLKVQKPEIFH